jgi:hypothetical protein
MQVASDPLFAADSSSRPSQAVQLRRPDMIKSLGEWLMHGLMIFGTSVVSLVAEHRCPLARGEIMPGRSTFPDAALRNSALRALSQRCELSPNTSTFPVLSEKRLRNCATLNSQQRIKVNFDKSSSDAGLHR